MTTEVTTDDRTEKVSSTDQTTPSGAHAHADDLTRFHVRIMFVLASGDDYGLGIKRQLEDFYGSEVSHGRLYPQLDRLVEAGLVEKVAADRRTNNYSLTETGREIVRAEYGWMSEQLEEGRTTLRYC